MTNSKSGIDMAIFERSECENVYIATRRWPVQARVASIELKELPQRHRLVGRWVVLRNLHRFSDISAISRLGSGRQPISEMVAAQRDCESEPGPLSPQAKSLTTTPSPHFLYLYFYNRLQPLPRPERTIYTPMCFLSSCFIISFSNSNVQRVFFLQKCESD